MKVKSPRIEQRFKVYLGLVNTAYLDPEQTRKAIRDGLSFCGYENNAKKIMLKPSLLHPDIAFGRHAMTAPEFFEAATNVLLSNNKQAKIKVSIEKNFLGISKATAFKLSGLIEAAKIHSGNVTFVTEEETRFYRVLLAKENELTRRSLTRSEELIFTECRILLPKIRTDLLSNGFGGAVRLGSESSIHTANANELCDALEVCNPDFIIGDGIIVPVGGSRITQIGQELGLVIVSNNALAHDIVAATVLNLDPNRIPHLQIAMDRGWGPTSIEDIDFGSTPGTSIDSLIKNLTLKTRTWSLGIFPVIRLQEKYEFENPGFKFPFEILAEKASESQVAANITLDSICMAMDIPTLRPKIAKWPKASLCIGEVYTYPNRELVYAIGTTACNTIDSIISSTHWSFSIGNISFSKVTFKNGEMHKLIRIGIKKQIDYWSLGFALSFISKGRIQLPYMKFKYLSQFIAAKIKDAGDKMFAEKEKNHLISSHFKQNSWWSTPPT